MTLNRYAHASSRARTVMQPKCLGAFSITHSRSSLLWKNNLAHLRECPTRVSRCNWLASVSADNPALETFKHQKKGSEMEPERKSAPRGRGAASNEGPKAAVSKPRQVERSAR